MLQLTKILFTFLLSALLFIENFSDTWPQKLNVSSEVQLKLWAVRISGS